MIRYIKEEDFNSVISNNKVLVDFYATWCGPCKMLSLVLEKYDVSSDIDIIKVDVDECPNLSKEYNIFSVPTLIVFENGKELKRISGFLSEEELRKWVIDNE